MFLFKKKISVEDRLMSLNHLEEIYNHHLKNAKTKKESISYEEKLREIRSKKFVLKNTWIQ
jgi:hypothetical protein